MRPVVKPAVDRGQRGRHDVGRILAGAAALGARQVGQHGVARGVDEHPRGQAVVALDVVDHDAAHGPGGAIGIGVDELGEQPHFHARFLHELVEHRLVAFRVEVRPEVKAGQLTPTRACTARSRDETSPSTISSIRPRTRFSRPLPMGSKLDTRPEVPMPPRQPVASISTTLAPLGRRDGGRHAGRPTAGDQQVIARLNRDFPHQAERARRGLPESRAAPRPRPPATAPRPPRPRSSRNSAG